MSELLIELFSEEIPARMQVRASEDLKRLVTDGITAAGLTFATARAYSTPRRLALVIDGLPAMSPAISEERKGPRVGAPEQALAGFLKAAGLASIADAEIVKDEKKGDYYVARIDKPGRKAADIAAELIPAILAKFPWPKSMRWGSGTFQWVRPLHSIICLLDGKVVPFEIAGIASGASTRGHRFHGNSAFKVKSFDDYVTQLTAHKVMLDPAARMATISEQAHAAAKAAKLQLVEDDALVAENAGLTEWPVVLMGSFDKDFLEVPGEVLTTSMKQHQKCFSVRDPKTKKLANKFILVSNLTATDGGQQIVSGNEKVIRARLSDAKFFWDQDLNKLLDVMANELAGITFHEKLGTQKDRVERIAELASQIAGAVDAVPEDARRAAQLAKADLVSGMVGEFPELQGLMGRYYAEKAGTKADIARAIELHYKPKGPTDVVPKEEDGDSVAIAVALADKLDTLVGFWAIGEKPTGSGDPYQLRRAALGIIRIILENDLRVRMADAMATGIQGYLDQKNKVVRQGVEAWAVEGEDLRSTVKNAYDAFTGLKLREFLQERLKVQLREKGAQHDLLDSVFALPGDDLALIVKRVEALGAFLATDDGANLLAGVKRASNILSIEEKKDKTTFSGEPEGDLLAEPAERALASAIAKAKFDTNAAIAVENFTGAMNALAELRAPVDAFFEKVTVNVSDPALRQNRLKLLSEIRAATLNVADFSRISG
ncbi:MAG: glycine--tRNA ligase subunit beta [Hyphomicrobium sp. 32-62-53]|nr:MAG: glycine--tRNA ligase subunit beta [Hyphomicrobium sp. 12-62-95]OYX99349.1 MAG: glycine--tRNA ligase subunit beta [Hyphomicrobium sp. 32-62-53]